jgi:hypothetical protein
MNGLDRMNADISAQAGQYLEAANGLFRDLVWEPD